MISLIITMLIPLLIDMIDLGPQKVYVSRGVQ